MRYVNIIPKNRDSSAKKVYKFMDWYMRKNRKEIEKQVEEYVTDCLLYGNPTTQR
jgi:hypothetical protein